MADDNKPMKYLRYAIGEIVLVVIGILIALQINNWNENKKIKQGTRDYLERLLIETQNNIDKADKEIEIEESQIKASKKILDMFNQERNNLESKTIDSLMSIVYIANSIDINLGIFTEGINGEKIGLINSDKLRTSLYSFIGFVDDMKIGEQLWRNDLHGSFEEFLFENFNYRNMDNHYGKYKEKIGVTHFKKFDNLSVLDNMKLENYIDNRFYGNNQQLEMYQNLSLRLGNIEKLIKKELNK